MAAWQEKARSEFPELIDELEQAESLDAFWEALQARFQQAYDGRKDEAAIARIHAFATWALSAGPAEAAATLRGFYEFLPSFGPAAKDMPRWFRYEEVAENRGLFSRLIGADGYESLLGSQV